MFKLWHAHETYMAHGNNTRTHESDKMSDIINNPDHYTDGGIETIDFIEAKQLNYRLGNAVKYISRAGKKGSKTDDLKKAIWYILREIDHG